MPSDTLAAPPGYATIARRIGALAGPTFAIAVVQSAGQLIETVLAARQGTLALAGWALVLPFALLMQQMSAGAMGGGVVSAIARSLGAGRGQDAAALVLHAVIIALLFALGFAVLLAGFPRTVLGAIGGPAAAEAAAGYAMWLFGVGAVATWMTNTLASVLRGGGKHGLAARVTLMAAVAQPPLAWVLMERAGLGLPGLGMATAASQWAAALVMIAVVMRGGAGFAPVLRVRPSRALFGRILAVGAVACTMAAVANLTTILVTARVAEYGAAAVAAYGISARLEFLMVPLAFGVGSALTALVGRAVGGGDWATARRTAWVGGGAAFVVCAGFGAAVGLFPGPFARFFTDDPAVVAIAARALGYVGPAFGAFGLGMALYFASMGAGRMLWPAMAGGSRIVLAVGGGALLAGPLGMGLDGQFLAVALGITAYGAVVAGAVRPGVWRAR
jgi:putative MATE family efflux protein